MKYEVRLNNQYMNSFESYNEACDFRDNILRRFKNAKIDIITIA